MKINKSFKLNYLFLLIALFTMGCENDDDNSMVDGESITLSDVTQGELKAVFDGETKTATHSIAVLGQDHFTMVVSFPGNKVLTINTDTLALNTFSLGLSSNGAVYIADSNTYVSTTGTVEFTEIDTENNTFTGKFNVDLMWEGEIIKISSAAFKSIGYTTESTEPSNSSFLATVNGESWQAEDVSVILNDQVNVLDITGEHSSGVTIGIYMEDNIAEGTYPLTPNGERVAIVYEPGQSVGTHYSNTGELTIIKHDTINYIIEAEFEFTASSQSSEEIYEVKNGEFSYNEYY